jgi:valyl-tRNA synthetase
MSSTELPKNYDPASSEIDTYRRWEESGFFRPERVIEAGLLSPDATPFTIIMPPPNATGILHMGHAMMLTIEDILVRFQRMRGRRTLWLPGTDHAAIATQSVVEKDIYKKEGKHRHDIGREELLRRIDAFVAHHRSVMTGQMRVMGASCDWSREAFTLDDARNRAVRAMFRRMYDDGLIYRGNRIVNWDPKGQTTISDDEVVYEERDATLYTFRYSADFPIAISTTRPETKVGDVAVAVHPDDARYTKYIGSTYDVEFCGVPLHITVVADTAADPAFGTGAVGVTPAHSQTDWDIAQRHQLPAPQVISEYARMMVGDERIKDKKVGEAREVIVTWLKETGLMEKEEPVKQNVAKAERTGGIVEPLPKLQWFVSVTTPFTMQGDGISGIPAGSQTTLKDLMRAVVAQGQISIIPEHFTKTYFHWIDNLRDWCISRQIWYGHRIPVWYRGNEIVTGEAPSGDGWMQDEDTLDTWFSSALWTFSTLGWPDSTEDLRIYHPTDVMETGYEILFFWVARMVLMTGYALGQIPFRTVYLHGTVRDQQGRKMSKSLGNGIDPIDVAQQFGADAGRMALVVGNTPGTDSRIWTDKIKAYRYFANKLWNIARYTLMQMSADDVARLGTQRPEPSTDADRAILAALDAAVASVTDNLDRFIIHEAAQTVYQFAWRELADVYLEASKVQLADEALAAGTRHMLAYCLLTTLRLVHPFAPFVTEEIWGRIHGTDDSRQLLMVAPWPSL